MQQEAEEGSLYQENLNDEFSEELTKIAAAVNNSFSHWKELQVDENRKCAGHVEQILPKAENIFWKAGHTEVADRTMEILAALQGVDNTELHEISHHN